MKIFSSRRPKKTGEIVEIVQNQKDGRQIAPSRSPLKDLSAHEEVDDLTAVSDGYGKSDTRLPRFFQSRITADRPKENQCRSATVRVIHVLFISGWLR